MAFRPGPTNCSWMLVPAGTSGIVKPSALSMVTVRLLPTTRTVTPADGAAAVAAPLVTLPVPEPTSVPVMEAEPELGDVDEPQPTAKTCRLNDRIRRRIRDPPGGACGPREQSPFPISARGREWDIRADLLRKLGGHRSVAE